MKSIFCVIGLFSLVMGVVILVFPYIMTLFNRFNKDRVLVWRKFFIIIIACYMPVLALLFGVGIAVIGTVYDMNPLWNSYYFIYLILAVIIKRRIDLQLGWFKFIGSATLYYLLTVILLEQLVVLSCKDPYLVCMFAACSP